MTIEQETIYPLKLYIKLGKDKLTAYNGRQVLTIYQQFLAEKETAWLPLSALTLGIAKFRQDEMMRAIQEGQTLEIYLAIGKTYDDANRIYGKAKVLAIQTNKLGMTTPEPSLTPLEWQIYNAKSWLKLTEFTLWEKLDDKPSDFIVASTGHNLAEAIQCSQMHFGYIMKH